MAKGQEDHLSLALKDEEGLQAKETALRWGWGGLSTCQPAGGAVLRHTLVNSGGFTLTETYFAFILIYT